MAEKAKQGRLDGNTMFPLMELFEDSKMTQKQFCVEMDLVPHTFTYWLNKHRKSKMTKEANPKFVELAVSPKQDYLSTERLMRITYPDGTLIELPVR